MKIAIIGGGFYGTFLAYRLGGAHDVTVFEQGSELMNRSAVLNQSRLHVGFHYPRCKRTIGQTAEGYSRFVAEFSSFLREIPQNIYAIHKDGKSQFDELRRNLAPYSIRYEEVSAPARLRNPGEYEAFLRVEEKLILLDRLKAHLVGGLKARVETGCEVTSIDADSGLVSAGGTHRQFDRVINTTFTNPNLGLQPDQEFKFAYELAAMVCLDSASKNCEAITIIDGDYVSLYPNYLGQDTLSSVRFTPFVRVSSRGELEDAWKRRDQIAQEQGVMEKILEDGKRYLDLGSAKGQGLWIAPKVKLLENPQNGAPSEVRVSGKLISVFCGKLDSVYSVLDRISEEMK